MENQRLEACERNITNSTCETPHDGVMFYSFVLWTMTIAVGVPGNALMTLTISYTTSLRTSMNTYLLSIGIVDFLTCALALPLRVYVSRMGKTCGDITCTLLSAELFIRTCTEVARLLLMMCLSVERYQAIARPFSVSKAQASKRALIIGGLACALAVFISGLAINYFCDSVLYMTCLIKDASDKWGLLETYVELPLTILAVLVIAISYSLIVVVLRQQGKKMSGHSRGKVKISQVAPATTSTDVESYVKKNAIRTFIVPESGTSCRNTIAKATEAEKTDVPNREDASITTSFSSIAQPHSLTETAVIPTESNTEHSYANEETLYAVDETPTSSQMTLLAFNPSFTNIQDCKSISHVSLLPTNNLTNSTEKHRNFLENVIRRDIFASQTFSKEASNIRPDSPCITTHFRDSCFNLSGNSALETTHNHPLFTRRASFHGLINAEILPYCDDLPVNQLTEYTSRCSTSICKHGSNSKPQKSRFVGKSPFLRSISEISGLKNPFSSYLHHCATKKMFCNKYFINNVHNANIASTEKMHPLHNDHLKIEAKNHNIFSVEQLIASNYSFPKCEGKMDAVPHETQEVDGSNGQSYPALPKLINVESNNNISVAPSVFSFKDSSLQIPLYFQNELYKAESTEISSNALNARNEDSSTSLIAITNLNGDSPNGMRLNKDKSISDSTPEDSKEINHYVNHGLLVRDEGSEDTQCNPIESVTKELGSQADNETNLGKEKSTTENTNKTSLNSEDKKLIQVVEMDGTVRLELQHEASAGQFDGAVCLMNPKNREQGRRRVELKAALKVGLLFCSFVCLWVPLPVFVVIMRETEGWQDKAKVDLLVIFSTLATSTAAVDPIIYGLLNGQIRSAAIVAVKKLRKKLGDKFRNEF